MSCYSLTLVHKETKEEHRIFAIDDYFGHHVYGYRLPKGGVVTAEYLGLIYETNKTGWLYEINRRG